MSNQFRLLLLVLIIMIGFSSLWYGFNQQKQTQNLLPSPSIISQPMVSPSPNSSTSPILGIQTKSTDCTASAGLPDRACTPGAIFPEATKEQICQKGYSASVRNVPDSEKKQVYKEYGIASHQPGEYEVDHLISLELGGSNEIANLWPEAAEPAPGFHEKDQVENYLHHQVCDGKISLSEAQQQIAADWKKVYQQITH